MRAGCSLLALGTLYTDIAMIGCIVQRQTRMKQGKARQVLPPLQAKQPPFDVQMPPGQGMRRVCELTAPKAVVKEACKEQSGGQTVRGELMRQAFNHAEKALQLPLCKEGIRVQVRAHSWCRRAQ